MPELTVLPSHDRAEDVVPVLERALELAKAGDVSAVAVAMVMSDGHGKHMWSKLPSFLAMIGTIDRLKFKLHQRQAST